jgi:hypothetical protein
VEPIEYRTIAQADSLTRMLEELNELGAQGWEVCAQASARTGIETVGRVAPRHGVLLLKRHKEPDTGRRQRY